MRRRISPTIVLLFLASTAGGTAGFRQEAGPAAAGTVVSVDAKHPWIDSGITVRKGDRLVFKAEGTIRWGEEPDHVAGPEGHGAKGNKLGQGGLIGRVGANGKPFAIGSNPKPIVMPKDGKLWLGINDFIFKDNDGAFTVTVSRAGP